MRFKKLLMIGLCGLTLYSRPVQAYPGCVTFVCIWLDPLGMIAGFVLRETNKKLLNPVYDIKQGLETIKENIGMYQDEGKCGISATGESGCSTASSDSSSSSSSSSDSSSSTTDTSVVDSHTIEIIAKSEKDGGYKYNASDEEAAKRDNIATTGSTFDQVRDNVALYMFATDDATTNADCTCEGGKTGNDCDATECAQTRQNNALVVSSTAASSTADTYLAKVSSNYDNLDSLVSEVNESETIADFVGALGKLSVYASSAAVEHMILQTYDLRTQSYRNLVASGVDKVDLSKLTKKEENK